MEGELTLGDVYDDISERLALARTKALMGERHEALGVFRGASLDYMRFREVLAEVPGFHALEHAFNITMAALDNEQAHTARAERLPRVSRPARTRKKMSQAA